MGLNLSVNILTAGFLTTVIIFFVIMAVLLLTAYNKAVEVLERGDARNNNLSQLEAAAKDLKIAYTLAFIASALTLILAVLYAGHETVWAPSEWIHGVIYFLTYALLVIAAIYAFLALNKLNTVGITNKNGSDSYIWAALLMAIFAFVGLTATGSGRIGMGVARGQATRRLRAAEYNVNEHLPVVRQKTDEVHASVVGMPPAVVTTTAPLYMPDQFNAAYSTSYAAPYAAPYAMPVSQAVPVGSSISAPLNAPMTPPYAAPLYSSNC